MDKIRILVALDTRDRDHRQMQRLFSLSLLLQHGKLVLQFKRIFRANRELPCGEFHLANIYDSVLAVYQHVNLSTAALSGTSPRTDICLHTGDSESRPDLPLVPHADALEGYALP